MSTLNWHSPIDLHHPRKAGVAGQPRNGVPMIANWIKSEMKREPGRIVFWAFVCLEANAFMFGWMQ